jgi:hypothetical protein
VLFVSLKNKNKTKNDFFFLFQKKGEEGEEVRLTNCHSGILTNGPKKILSAKNFQLFFETQFFIHNNNNNNIPHDFTRNLFNNNKMT